MGQAVVKCSPDSDLYFVWSTVVDAPIWVGDRTELIKYLWDEYNRDHPGSTPSPSSTPEARVARADDSGTSMRDPAGLFGWDDEMIRVVSGAPADGWYQIRRDRLVAYAEAILRDDEDGARALLERDTELDADA